MGDVGEEGFTEMRPDDALNTSDPEFKKRVLERLLADANQPDEPSALPEPPDAELDDPEPAPLPPGPIEIQPCGPGVGAMGSPLVPFTCAKCGVLDHVDPFLKEVYDVRRLWCLPCQSPHIYKWKRDAETGDRFLYPVPFSRQKPPLARLGEAERRELELRHGELIDARTRRDYLKECVVAMQAELAQLEPRIEELRTVVVPAAQAALEAIETDPQREQKQSAADISRELTNLMASLAKKDDPAARAKKHRDQQARLANAVPDVGGAVLCNCPTCVAQGQAQRI